MIKGFFGLPGSGKTSLLTYFAQTELKRISKGKSKYKRVYSTFYCLGCYKLNWQDLGEYFLRDCLILIDEVTLEQDSRDWKNLKRSTKDFICLHRHFNIDIIYTVQDWSRCEKTLRENTVELYYLSKMGPFVFADRIYRILTVNDMVGDLILGYRFRNSFREFLSDLFSVYYVKKYWKCFDTHDLFGFDKKPQLKNRIWGYPDPPAQRMRAGRSDDSSKFDLIVDLSNKGG